MVANWDSLDIAESDIGKAVDAHNAALAALHGGDGRPIYAPDIMRERATAARQQLTAALDRVQARAEAFATRAAGILETAEDDIYGWLTDEELHRAALLAPFVAEDAARLGPDGLRRLALQVQNGRRKVDRPRAWLLMRAAEAAEVPADGFARVVVPAAVAEAMTEAARADRLMRRLAEVRPEYAEHIQRDIIGNAHWTATGQPIAK